MRYRILQFAFYAWTILWVFFIGRELFAKGAINEYRELMMRSTEGKRSYVTGDRFYEFLTFCNKELPKGAGYYLAGLEEGDLSRRRAAYYLYPHLEGQDAEFILICDKAILQKDGYAIFAKLDEGRYILRKKAR